MNTESLRILAEIPLLSLLALVALGAIVLAGYAIYAVVVSTRGSRK